MSSDRCKRSSPRWAAPSAPIPASAARSNSISASRAASISTASPRPTPSATATARRADCTISVSARNLREDGQGRTRRHVRLHAGQAARRRRHGPRHEARPDPGKGARLTVALRAFDDAWLRALDTRAFVHRPRRQAPAHREFGRRAGAAAARGVCVLLHGQTEFIEKYDEVDRRAARARLHCRDVRLARTGRLATRCSPIRSKPMSAISREYDDDLAQLSWTRS